MICNKRAVAAAAGLVVGSAFGAGFQLYTEGSAEALGQAGAISGRKGMISQAWYNPSALAGAERPQIMVGSAFASIRTDYKSGLDPSFDSSMSDEWQAIPHLYYVQPLSEDFTAALSVNAPYGLITEWPDSWGPTDPGTGLPGGSLVATYSELQAIYITPTVAWKPIDMLSVAAGVNVVSANAQLEGTGRIVEGDDIGYGGTLSAHLQPWENWGFGLRYQSSVKLDIEGTLDLSAPYPAGSASASANLELPSTINVGVANSSVKNLSLGLDLVWTEWSTYDQLVIENSAGIPLESDNNWDDVISIRLGAEYALGDTWKLRAGYVWDESPVPDETRGPMLPGSDRQMIAMGLGWQFWKTMNLDVAYSYLWADEAPAGGDLPVGEYETTTHLVALSVGYTF